MDTQAPTEPMPRYCAHGCGERVTRLYRPGHDSKHVAWLLEEVRLGITTPAVAVTQMPTPNMHNKMVRALRRRGIIWNPETCTFTTTTKEN